MKTLCIRLSLLAVIGVLSLVAARLALARGSQTPQQIADEVTAAVAALSDGALARGVVVFDQTRDAVIAVPPSDIAPSKQFRLFSGGLAKVERDARRTAAQIRRTVARGLQDLALAGADANTVQTVTALYDVADEIEVEFVESIGVNFVEEISKHRGWGFTDP